MIQWAWRTCLGVLLFCVPAPAFLANAADAPVPLLEKDKPVDWWFVYKFNAQTFRPATRMRMQIERARLAATRPPTGTASSLSLPAVPMPP
jgi:hypothetical protein